MTTTDFAKYLTKYFTEHLVSEKGVSDNTIRSYGGTFSLLLIFMEEMECVKADRLSCSHFDKDVILRFLDWLQNSRQCGIATRNQRLAAIHSFFKYLQYEDTKQLARWQDILSIKIKRGTKKSVSYLCIDGIQFLLQQIPVDTKEGRRNLALIALLYDSGARVQELIDLTPSSLRLNKPYCITLSGKGSKKRIVPLLEEQIKLLQTYMEENRLNEPIFSQRPLFSNNRGGKLTNSGITYILNTYAHNARMLKPELIPDKISPHTLRHSKAMHLLQAGVNLVYIRDILGHVSIQTTEIYARADSKLKREALEAAYVSVIPNLSAQGSWEKDNHLKTWLKNLSK
jgi:site-specific recombinase XerD